MSPNMLKIIGNTEDYTNILSQDAVRFIELLCERFRDEIEQLLEDPNHLQEEA